MKIFIDSPKVRNIHLDGEFYDTNTEIDVNFSVAQKLSRITNVKFSASSEAYNPALFRVEKKFAFQSHVDTVSGWGNVSLNLIKYSVPPYAISLLGRLLNVTDRAVINASRNEVDPQMAVVIHEQPKAEWISSLFQKKIAVVPFETTRIPASWVPRINSCDALLTPCKQNIQMFLDSGVTIPIELIHWGVDPDKFYELERPRREIFSFGTMGALSTRKGTDILISAFQKAFPTEQDVQLICKTSNNYFLGAVKDKRVKIEMTPVSHDELLRDFFQKVDCFVFPTRGEGFGLTPLEALATGIPAIVTGWSGPLEYMTPEVGWLIEHTMVPAKDFSENIYKEDCGDWAEPSVDHLVKLMRYAYEHQDEVREKGKAAAEHVRQNWKWSDKIKMYHEALEKHL